MYFCVSGNITWVAFVNQSSPYSKRPSMFLNDTLVVDVRSSRDDAVNWVSVYMSLETCDQSPDFWRVQVFQLHRRLFFFFEGTAVVFFHKCHRDEGPLISVPQIGFLSYCCCRFFFLFCLDAFGGRWISSLKGLTVGWNYRRMTFCC